MLLLAAISFSKTSLEFFCYLEISTVYRLHIIETFLTSKLNLEQSFIKKAFYSFGYPLLSQI